MEPMGEVEDQFDLAEQIFQQLQDNTVEVPDTQQETSTEPNLAAQLISPEEYSLIEITEDDHIEVTPVDVTYEREAEGTVGESLSQLERTLLNDEISDEEAAELLNDLDNLMDNDTTELPENADEFFSQILETLHAVYPKRSGEVTNLSSGNMSQESGKTFFIHFPEIEISNTRGHTHTILDLFVFIGFKLTNGKFEMLPYLEGTRLTQTPLEHYNAYQHSHLGSSEAGRITHFCLGGGTPTSVAIADLATSFDIMKFELFLYQIDAYVRHESIEGGPYKRMNQMSFEGGYRHRPDRSKIYIDDVMRQLSVTPLIFDALFNKYTESINLGYFANFNLKTNLDFLRLTAKFADYHDDYVDGNFIPQGSENVEDRYTEAAVKDYRKESFKIIEHDTIIDMVAKVLPIEAKKDENSNIEVVPPKHYVETLEKRIETAFKLYLNRNQTYEYSE
jgi:hypothetical protein